MSTVVTKYAQNKAGIEAWSNFDAAHLGTDDADYAYRTVATSGISEGYTGWGRVCDFGFAIPDGSTIISVVVEAEWYANHADNQQFKVEVGMYGEFPFSMLGQSVDSNRSSPYVFAYSLPALPSIAQLNSSNFAIAGRGHSSDPYATPTYYVDFVRVTVTYDPPVAPTLTTTAASSVAWDSATSGGNVSSDGGMPVTDRGVCWNEAGTPTTADSHTHDGSGSGAFTSAVTGLEESHHYHLRAWATNSVGTSYGGEVTLDTPAKPTYYLAGAVGRTTAWNRVLTAAEVLADYDADQVIYERSMAKGNVVLTDEVRTRTGAPVPAIHVRAGWWVQNLDWQPDPRLPAPTLYVTGHSVDLAGRKNALTIGEDWMEKELGVKMAELLAMPSTSEMYTSLADEAAADPYMPDEGYAGEAESSAETPLSDQQKKYLQWRYDAIGTGGTGGNIGTNPYEFYIGPDGKKYHTF